MKALNYLYRNLHTNTFSIRFKGLVIKHPTSLIMNNVSFKVNENSRKRVVKEKRKNVHAFLTFDGYEEVKFIDISNKKEIYYDPYIYKNFIIKSTKKPIFEIKTAYGFNNKIYID